MNITINGEEKTTTDFLSLNELIEQIGINSGKFAIEINGVIIPKSKYTTFVVTQNDTIEIVRAVGGG